MAHRLQRPRRQDPLNGGRNSRPGAATLAAKQTAKPVPDRPLLEQPRSRSVSPAQSLIPIFRSPASEPSPALSPENDSRQEALTCHPTRHDSCVQVHSVVGLHPAPWKISSSSAANHCAPCWSVPLAHTALLVVKLYAFFFSGCLAPPTPPPLGCFSVVICQ